jgi:hypothetical protein
MTNSAQFALRPNGAAFSRFGLMAFLFLAFWLSDVPSYAQVAAGAAVVTNAAGRVSIERSGELWAVSTGQPINVGQVMITGTDGFAELSLPDGSHLEVFPNSRFAYRANQFSLRDAIDLYLGKIRFHIQKVTKDDPSIRVNSPTAVISVRGTVFDVEVDSTETTRVSVDEGAVAVRHRLMPGQEVLLHPGESIEVMEGVPLAASKSVIPRTIIGNVVRAVGNTLAQIKTQRSSGGGSTAGSSGGHSGASGGTGGGISGSDSGSNEGTPPPSGGSGDDSQNSGPPGDKLP